MAPERVDPSSKRERQPALGSNRRAPTRRTVDLRRLPLLAQYAIAIAIAALVMALAWRLRYVSPGPSWLREYLLPAWPRIGVALLGALVIARLLRAARRK